ncbi:type II toxin-antitoxin system RelE/ParE family toxin [Homoserinimonas sp. OAct 916]|uniref:type II toxin-antitoxin system RelE family toxin n=1 Tax=Homoserinimonas sp. OAct 916 TaxID=2211450 RepID=UPI000DBE6719|nr:type II toxin-antitoxin system RelE/ParE family toxin [Homoserinimonas sp. OAct 916]
MNEESRYSVLYDPKALKEIGNLDKAVARRVVKAIDRLSSEPRPAGVRALVGFPGLFRIRVGDYRIVYTVKGAELIVLVLRVAHRSVVYRKL